MTSLFPSGERRLCTVVGKIFRSEIWHNRFIQCYKNLKSIQETGNLEFHGCEQDVNHTFLIMHMTMKCIVQCSCTWQLVRELTWVHVDMQAKYWSNTCFGSRLQVLQDEKSRLCGRCVGPRGRVAANSACLRHLW